MRRASVITLVVLVAAVSLVGGCSDDDGDASGAVGTDWPRFTDPVLGVTFQMPDDPETITQGVQLPDGSPSEIVVHALSGEGWELYVSTFPVDADAFSLDGAAPGAAAAVNGDLEAVHPVTVEGRPGRDAEIRFLVDGEPRLLLYRAVLLDEGLVQLQTVGPVANRDDLEQRHQALVDGVSWD